jgi:hypothetical protein
MSFDWRVVVDWNNDNEFSDSGEDITAYVAKMKWRLGCRRAFQLMTDEPTATIDLINTDGRFNPENSSSPLYPNVLPQRRIKILANRYDSKLKDGLIQYLQLDEISGSTADDASAEGNDATYSAGVVLDAADAPVAGDRMVVLDGDDHINLYSAGLDADFDPDEGSFVLWAKASDGSIWTDGSFQMLFRLLVDGSNFIQCYKSDVDNQLVLSHVAGGTNRTVTITNVASITSTNVFCIAGTWSKSAGRVRFYLNGTLESSDSSALGTWAGSLDSTVCCLGAQSVLGTIGWEGNLSHYRLYNRELTADEVMALYQVDDVLWTGWIDRVEPEWKPAGDNTGKTKAKLHCVGAKQLLENVTADLSLYEDVTGDVIVADILQKAIIPPAAAGLWLLEVPGFSELELTTWLGDETNYSDVETGLTTFEYFSDTSTLNGWNGIQRVTEGERGRFFFDREGKAVWWNRHHLILTDTVAGTISTNGTYRPVELDPQHSEFIANVVRVQANPRKDRGTTQLYQLDKPVEVSPGQTQDFEVDYKDNYGLKIGGRNPGIINDVWGSSGSGVLDITNLGNRARVTVDNSAGTDVVELSSMEIEGEGLSTHHDIIAVEEDSDSIATYGRRELSYNLDALTTLDQAKEVAQFELFRRKTPFGSFRYAEFLNQSDGVNNLHHLEWMIGTRLATSFPELGHDDDHFIVGEEHEVRLVGDEPIHVTRFYLEPAGNYDFWILETSLLEVDTYLGY